MQDVILFIEGAPALTDRVGSPSTRLSIAYSGRPLFLYVEVGTLDLLEAIVTFIQNVGFPIACVVAMFWMWDRERQEHKAEAEKWAEAIANNTAVMQKLVDRLEDVK